MFTVLLLAATALLSPDAGAPLGAAAAPEKVTNAIHAHTEKITRILQSDGIPDIDLSTPSTYRFGATDKFVTAEVFDSAETHEAVLRDCFDFPAIKSAGQAALQRGRARVDYLLS